MGIIQQHEENDMNMEILSETQIEKHEHGINIWNMGRIT
jgi:hypothetical protein